MGIEVKKQSALSDEAVRNIKTAYKKFAEIKGTITPAEINKLLNAARDNLCPLWGQAHAKLQRDWL